MPTRSELSAATTQHRDDRGSVADVETRVDDALARAVICRFVSLAFSPPSAALDEMIHGAARREALERAVSRLGLEPLELDAPADLGERFDRLFEHTLRGRVCPYETEYGKVRGFQQGHELADIQGWYSAFGLQRRTQERVDHIALEFEFLGFLAQREAYALETRNRDQAEGAHIATRTFLRDHLAQFGIFVTTQIERADAEGLHGRAGALGRRFLMAECDRLDVRPGPQTLSLRPEDDDVPSRCGDVGDPTACSSDCGPTPLPPLGDAPSSSGRGEASP